MASSVAVITEQERLEATCRLFAGSDYVTIDTEFMRERTYWPQLCLVQLARPAKDADDGEIDAVIIDPLSDLDLEPLFELMRDRSVLKVFHAARQDVEIFVNLMNEAPQPLFDTQVAAMVCGYGDQVGYETLVRRVAKETIDKSSRFTDWARRPLSPKQLTYAIGDVTHLRDIYEDFAVRLGATGRSSWVEAEIDVLTTRETYIVEPEHAWRRIKTRSNDRRFLGVVRTLAEWRERQAQDRNVPRGRILKDDAILEIAAAKPTSRDQLMALRSLQREGRKSATADAILQVVAAGLENPADAPPRPPQRNVKPEGQALSELLRVLLKTKAEELGVAQRLIASAADLEALAHDGPEGSPVMSGWRREAFGDDALKLMNGGIALGADRKGVKIITL